MEYQASLLLCIPGIIVIELVSTHAQFLTSSTTKKWQQALKPMSLTHEVISPVYFRLAFDQLILIAVPITTDYCLLTLARNQSRLPDNYTDLKTFCLHTIK
jgi:hypothetical protein